MKLWQFILLLGNCFLHWTSAENKIELSPLKDGQALVSIKLNDEPTTVDLSNLNISAIHDNALDALTNITVLDLSKNKIRQLQPRIFSKLHNLKKLSLATGLSRRHRLPLELTRNVFHGLNNLESLDLSGYVLSELKSGYFAGLPKFVNITVNASALEDLSSAVFKNEFDPVHMEEALTDHVDETSESPDFGDIPVAFAIEYTACMANGILESIEEAQKVNNCTYFTPLTCLVTDDGSRVLQLEENGVEKIEDGAFAKLNLTKLNIMSNPLKSMKFIKTLPATLEVFSFDNSQGTEITPDSFSHLKKLKKLSMTYHKLKNLEGEIFNGLENLEVIDFANNKIDELKRGLFAGLHKIFKISFAGNDIEKIYPDIFRGLNLSMLDLSWNKVRIIRRGTFSNTKINKLVLTGNIMSSIEAGAFDGAHIVELDLSMNSLKEFKEETLHGISGVKYFSLYMNPLGTIEKGSMLNLREARNVNLGRTEINALENGTLFGLSTNNVRVMVEETPITLIQGGVFDKAPEN